MEKVKQLASGINILESDNPKKYPSIHSSVKRPATGSSVNTLNSPPSKKIKKQPDISASTLDSPSPNVIQNKRIVSDDIASISQQQNVKTQIEAVHKELPAPINRLISKLPPQSSITHENAVELFYISANRAKIHPDFEFIEKDMPKKGKKKAFSVQKWICNLFVGDLLLCSAEKSSKAEAKRACFATAINMLFDPGVCVKQVNCVNANRRKYTLELCINATFGGDFKNDLVVGVEDNLLSVPAEKLHVKGNIHKSNFNNFILVESSTNEDPITTMMCSSARNKVEIEFDISETPVKHNDETGYLGTLTLGGKTLAQVVHQDRKAVKRAVADAAVKTLKTVCFTIRTRFHEHESAQSNAVSMESAKSEEQKSTKITSGIGLELLKKMGWSGTGGLGKTGQGRVEPVLVVERSHREGFGNVVATPSDVNALKEMVKNFATSRREDDLVFSSKLSSEQRKVLHTTCRKFNLKSTSYGKDDDRYLIVSRKRDLHQLLEYIIKNGGETLQYTLVPPSE